MFFFNRPRVELHARVFFRHVRCTVRKADCVAETVALCWKWFVRLAQKGKDAAAFVSSLASFAARAVRSGRRLCGQERARDVFSCRARQRQGFTVESLPQSTRTSLEDLYATPHGQEMQDAFGDRLKYNLSTPVLDQVAFRIDWSNFYQTLIERDRQLAQFLALGHSNKQTARRFKLSPGRVTQIRQRLCKEWHNAHGEKAPFEA
jgi:hypothetical protein